MYKKKKGGRRFAELVREVSMIDPEMRVRLGLALCLRRGLAAGFPYGW